MDDDIAVLVVGGSLVGLSTSLFLGWHGVPSLTVERHRGTAIHPRAAMVLQRTVEVYRSTGIEREVMEAAEAEFVQNGALVSVESLAGRELEWYYRSVNEGVEALSPSPRLFVTQIGLEPVLRRRAEELGGRLEYGTELVSFEADDDGVTALLRARDGGAERRVRARYVVAADGAHSPVRERLGIALRGRGSFSKSITIYFRADVRALLRGRVLSVIYVVNARVQGFFRFSIDGDAGFLVVNGALGADGQRTTDLSGDTGEARCVEFVREALGAPDLPVEIEDVQRWDASAVHAERYRDGRVFLAGDAAHVMPPTGGFGGNVGVIDAHNLAWKLASVLDGSAGERLLDSYDAERRPVGELTVEQAYTRYVLRLDPSLGTDDLQPFLDDATIELGFRYRSDAVVAEDDEAPENPHEPSGRPGTRAPHVPLERGGERISTLDLLGRRFCLLAGRDGDDWRAAAARLPVPVDVHRVGVDVGDPEDSFAAAYGTGAAGASLVRPDGVVAWRSHEPRPDALDDVLRRVLAR